MSDRCPYCFTELSDDTWTRDPLVSISGAEYDYTTESGDSIIEVSSDQIQYKGLYQITSKDISELQNLRESQEEQVGIPTNERTSFSAIDPNYFVIKKQYIQELRDSTEKILEHTGQTLENYLNFDNENNQVQRGTYYDEEEEIFKMGYKYQTNWFDPNLNYGHIDIRHIEDLRKYNELFTFNFYGFYFDEDWKISAAKWKKIDELDYSSTNLPSNNFVSTAQNQITVSGDEKRIYMVENNVLYAYDITDGLESDLNLIKSKDLPEVSGEPKVFDDETKIYLTGHDIDQEELNEEERYNTAKIFVLDKEGSLALIEHKKWDYEYLPSTLPFTHRMITNKAYSQAVVGNVKVNFIGRKIYNYKLKAQELTGYTDEEMEDFHVL